MADPAPRLELHGVSKTFGHRRVLSDVDLTVRAGEIHGVVGQNGSGKSTLAKVISGYHAPDHGARLAIDGTPVPFPLRLPDLHAAGVSIVYQDLGILPDRTVTSNVRIGAMQGRGISRRIDWPRERGYAARTLDRLGYAGSMDQLAQHLSEADRARVAIARALQNHPAGRGLIVLDESTRALSPGALAEFYATLRSLVREGTSVLLIAHGLDEVIEYCDRVSVLRDGRCVASGVDTEGLSEATLAVTMLGDALADFHRPEREIGEPGDIRIDGLLGAGLTEPLSLDLARGEIVGLTGMPGSGFDTVTYLLGGALPASGKLVVDGKELRRTGSALARRGVVLVPGQRMVEGLGAEQSIRDNVVLPWLPNRSRKWSVGRWRDTATNSTIKKFGVVPANPAANVGTLSGGNQQKVLLGKWLAENPRLLLVNEPTQAVDVGARRDILEALHRVAESGTAILLASAEASDLSALCDRVLVFGQGRVATVLNGPISAHDILDATWTEPAR
ncbi:sugar ABC transporter ATP-binding protein [Amycolatopsis jejuensis]|uniref:sugar ABC transporter ATP-binding protein n=1 Tax=Amycolatopsis jejuensis TaxID=330084 RepID=UPI0005249BE8|nr:sugar ABC transporter ATP-binding protein [Amycolatopsis jejuensis]